MITSSRKLKFMNINNILRWTEVHLSKNLNTSIKLYRIRCYIMCAILIEVDFEKMVNKLEKVEVKIDEKREHIREVEMTTRMVKEPKI